MPLTVYTIQVLGLTRMQVTYLCTCRQIIDFTIPKLKMLPWHHRGVVAG